MSEEDCCGDISEECCDDVPEWTFDGFENNPKMSLEEFKKFTDEKKDFDGILNNDDESFLMYVCKTSTIVNINYLLEKGHNLNKTNGDGNSSLSSACSNNILEVIEFLIGKGAKFECNDQKWNLLHFASYSNPNENVIQFLCKSIDPNSLTENGETPLMLACKNNNLSILKLLLKFQPNLNQKDTGEGSTPLHYAVIFDKLDIVKLLLENNSDPNSKDKYGYTPLLYAVMDNKLEFVKILISKTDLEIKYLNNDEYVKIFECSDEGDECYKFLMEYKNKK